MFPWKQLVMLKHMQQCIPYVIY